MRAFGLALGLVACVVLLAIAIGVGSFTPFYNWRSRRFTDEAWDYERSRRIPNRIFAAIIALGLIAWMLIRYG